MLIILYVLGKLVHIYAFVVHKLSCVYGSLHITLPVNIRCVIIWLFTFDALAFPANFQNRFFFLIAAINNNFFIVQLTRFSRKKTLRLERTGEHEILLNF